MLAITRNGEIYEGRTYVGEVRACSIYDPEGASYVHIIKDKRERYGMPQDPYDLFFDTRATATEFVCNLKN